AAAADEQCVLRLRGAGVVARWRAGLPLAPSRGTAGYHHAWFLHRHDARGSLAGVRCAGPDARHPGGATAERARAAGRGGGGAEAPTPRTAAARAGASHLVLPRPVAPPP